MEFHSSKLGAGRQTKSKTAVLCAAEWNVCTLLDRTTSQRPERQTVLVALEMNWYSVDIAAIGETRLPGYDMEWENN